MTPSSDAEAGRRSNSPSLVRRFLSVPADLLLGAACHGCDQPGFGLCAGCRAEVTTSDPTPTRPDPCPPGFPPTVTAGPYDELLRRLISGHKERQAWLLTGVLADRLAAAVELLVVTRAAAPGEPLLLVPIPSAPAAVRSRGRDATAMIAAAAARRLRIRRGWSVRWSPMLYAARPVADQTELDAIQRRHNLAGAYAVKPAYRHRSVQTSGAKVILVDDLVTTGASLAEARRAVAEMGIEVLGAAVVAATVRRHPRARPASARVLDQA